MGKFQEWLETNDPHLVGKVQVEAQLTLFRHEYGASEDKDAVVRE